MRRPLISVGLAALILVIWPATALAATDPGLNTAANFAVLGGSGASVTNTGPSWITGAIGAGAGFTGFPPGTAGPQHNNDGVFTQAQTDLTSAYAAAVQPITTDYTGVNLGGKTLTPGVYNQTTAPTLTGTLTLNGSGVYIFLIGSTLVTANNAVISLINGAQPCQIYWRVVTAATIAPSTAFEGTIMAGSGIQMQTGATLFGRALTRTGGVTLDTNRIIQPSGCGYTGPAFVAAPAGNILPATLGVPWELINEIPWLLVIAVGAGFGATVLVVSNRRRRRNSA